MSIPTGDPCSWASSHLYNPICCRWLEGDFCGDPLSLPRLLGVLPGHRLAEVHAIHGYRRSFFVTEYFVFLKDVLSCLFSLINF